MADVAKAMKRPAEEIAAWEAGTDFPTFAQLEDLARRFKRPVAVFFFPSAPIEPDPRREFRTLPDAEIDAFERDTLIAFREALAFQDSLAELTGGTNPATAPIFRSLRPKAGLQPTRLAQLSREQLGVTLEIQAAWKSPETAFEAWRGTVERAGVFVFKRSMKQRSISGFCLMDPQFPIILVNNSTPPTRQIFSLMHELGHILYNVSGVTKDDPSYIDTLPPSARHIEVACNEFAAEALVPISAFEERAKAFQGTEPEVEALADVYSVSREVVLRRLLSLGLVSSTTYQAWVAKWNALYKSAKGKAKGSGSYYPTHAAYLGRSYLRLAFTSYYSGKCNLEALADHLHVKASNVEGLERFALR